MMATGSAAVASLHSSTPCTEMTLLPPAVGALEEEEGAAGEDLLACS